MQRVPRAGPVGRGDGRESLAHLQNSLSTLLSAWKEQVCEGVSGQGCGSRRAAVLRTVAATSTAPSSFILPCGDRGTERVRPTEL